MTIEVHAIARNKKINSSLFEAQTVVGVDYMMSIIRWYQRIFGIDTKINCDQPVHDVPSFEDLHNMGMEDVPDIVSPLNEIPCKIQENEIPSPEGKSISEKVSIASFDELVEDFLRQFHFDPTMECPFIFQEGYLETFQCVLSVSKLAFRHQRIKNLFPDDDTIVYFTTFPRDKPALISFMDFVLKKAMCKESFSIYGLDGNAIISELYLHTDRTFQSPPLSKEANLFQEKALQYTRMDQLGNCIKQLYEFLCTNLYDSNKAQYEYLNREFNLDVYEKMCEIMNVDAGSSVRWKNEFNLYRLVKKHYDETIYQFRASWLGAQSLDIFIPSLSLAIEYQGVQHYKKVDLFGGEEEFQNRKINDEKKRIKCKENNVKLLEWPYTDDVSEGNLKIKFERVGIVLPNAKKVEIPMEDDKYIGEPSRLDDPLISFLNESLCRDNLAEKLHYIETQIKNNNVEEIKRTLCNVTINFSERTATAFFKIILRYDASAVYQAICGDERLLDYWVSTSVLNFYGRKIVFTLENQNPGSDCAAKYLKKMRMLEKKRGVNPDVRFMNALIRKEAVDNGISEERIKSILRKSY